MKGDQMYSGTSGVNLGHVTDNESAVLLSPSRVISLDGSAGLQGREDCLIMFSAFRGTPHYAQGLPGIDQLRKARFTKKKSKAN